MDMFCLHSVLSGDEFDAVKTDSERSSFCSRDNSLSPSFRKPMTGFKIKQSESASEIDDFFCDERLNKRTTPNDWSGIPPEVLSSELSYRPPFHESTLSQQTQFMPVVQSRPVEQNYALSTIHNFTPKNLINTDFGYPRNSVPSQQMRPMTDGPMRPAMEMYSNSFVQQNVQQNASQFVTRSPMMSHQQQSPQQQHLSVMKDNRDVQLNYTQVFVVAFKTQSKDYILGTRVPTQIHVGDAVMVVVDKGEDLGIVTRILTVPQFMMERFHTTFVPPQFNIHPYVGCISRLATPREYRMLAMKINDEKEVLEYARHLAHNVYNLNLRVNEVEYQFDRHKITIYFESKTRVDYRQFVQDIYNTFGARVWMERAPN